MGSKLNSNLIDGDIGGGTTIANVNDLSNALQGTILPDVDTWESSAGITIYYTSTLPIPLHSPLLPPPYLEQWDFCYDISDNGINFDSFITVNFGQNRDHEIITDITFYDVGERLIRAYYKIKSYPDEATTYKTQYKQSSFIVDLFI